MRNVKLKTKVFFLALILLAADNGYSDICKNIYFHTDTEASAKSMQKYFFNFVGGKHGNLGFDPNLLKEIKVNIIADQGVDDYFNPKIQVCDYKKYNCYELSSETSCHHIYGTQTSGAGVSAAVFIDWEGTEAGTFIREGVAQGLQWEWADGVTDEEQKKFANSPKICACSQKAACMGNFFSYFSKIGKGENIFRPGDMENVCDTCYQKKVKCAPVPLAPGPPPFCEQLGISPLQVRIVPITNNDNDYLNPKVKVIIGNLKDDNGEIGKRLNFPKKHREYKGFSISDERNTTHHFRTYKEKDKLCAEYYGTKGIDKKNRQFSRCFPVPPAPRPEIVGIVKDLHGNLSDMLEIKMKMSKDTCRAYGTYSGDSCIISNLGPLSLTVVKPKIVPKITDSSDKESYIHSILEKILDQSKDKDFKILKKYGYVPDIQVGCSGSQYFYNLKDFNEEKIKKCELDSLGRPEIEVKYTENPKSKMLCLSEWKPEPEEFALEREGKVISLKKIGRRYAKYNTVYSKESNQSYYFPCNETVDLLAKPQIQLDEMIFNNRGYVSIPEENKNRDNCNVKKTDEIDATQNCSKCKIVYKLIDTEHKRQCNQGDDGCMCFNNVCERSTQYVNKDNQYFYLKISQKQDGTVEKLEIPTKANRTEVFYADKLCRFDLEGLKKRLHEIIIKRLQAKKDLWENTKTYDLLSRHKYTDNLSKYDYVEIEAWGGGESGHIIGKAHSTEDRQGMPGDYIKAKLKIDPNYPFIQVNITEGGGNSTSSIENKDGGPTTIKMCSSNAEDNCRDFITVGGGGQYKRYGPEMEKVKTKVHKSTLEQGETQDIVIAKIEDTRGKNNQVAYIENGQIKYESVRCDNLGSNNTNSSSKHGAGGCIDKDVIGKNYTKGSPGYAIIRPILNEINANTIDNAINKMINNPNIITSDDSPIKELSDDPQIKDLLDDALINKLDPGIIKTIKEEIRKELLEK